MTQLDALLEPSSTANFALRLPPLELQDQGPSSLVLAHGPQYPRAMTLTDVIHGEISLDECWARLEEESLGRLAVGTAEGVEIFPINFLVHDRALYMRTAPGCKLVELTRNPIVAFEIDGRRVGTRWSVVVKGEARRLTSDTEIEASGILALHTATPTAKWNYVRISPDSVTGRQVSMLEGLSDPL